MSTPNNDVADIETTMEEVQTEDNLSLENTEGTVEIKADTSTKEKSLSGDWVVIQLPENLTLADLDDFKVELQSHLGQRVRLHGQSVQRIDTAAVQLLVSFVNSPKVTVSWEDHCDKLNEVTQLLGLSNSMNIL